MLKEYPEQIKSLPIFPYLDKICDELKNTPFHSLVLTAETAAGKSTAVPFALLKNFSGKIFMLEPRRVAAFNIANRVSSLLGEETGKTCGYTVHLENKTSSDSRFVVMTEAVLTRKLQSDPLLEGVSVIVIDEFHERSLHADLALALLKEVLSIRDDLYLIIMSATIDTERLCRYLKGTDESVESVPIISVTGRNFPVEIEYCKYLSVEKVVEKEVESLLKLKKYGSILVFLAGLKEIRKTESRLKEINPELKIEVLHSSVSFTEQKRVLETEESSSVRVILSSSIAETSVTIKDVVCVIDSGQCRYNVYDLVTGINRLENRFVSEFNAKQRAGRAGRISKGKCIRLWGQNELLVKSVPPEILRSDLSTLLLECYKWGVKEPLKLQWLDKPAENNLKKAEELLYLLGCIKDKKLTSLGEACLSLGIDIRLACLVLSGSVFNQLELSTDYALDKVISRFEKGKNLEKMRILLKNRVQIYKKDADLRLCFPQRFSKFSTSYALLSAYPDRLSVKESEGVYKMASGRKAFVKDEKTSLYIVILEADSKNDAAIVYEYENIDTEIAESFMKERAFTCNKYDFSRESFNLSVIEELCFGKIVLKEKKKTVTSEIYFDFLKDNIIEKGISFLPLSEKSENLLKRVQFYCQNKGTDSEFLSQKRETLSHSTEIWLKPFMANEIVLSEKIVFDALYNFLDGYKIDKDVPEIFILENGKKCRIFYENKNGQIIPVLEIIIQQIFGCFKTPKIMNSPILLKLLSPARRPLQITSDLENFWTNAWPEICSEMKGRYPKHNWNYKIVDNSVNKV